MTTLKPLTDKDCPLLPGEPKLVEQFNNLLQSLENLRREMGANAEDAKALQEAVGRHLEKAVVKLTRTHYRVGFLGTTAAGKSTTVNNLLRVAPEDAPAKAGSGPATTAAPSRIRKSRDGVNTITLRYMNEGDYETRRSDMAAHLNFGAALTEDELVEKCRSLEAEHARGELVRQKLDDLVTLRLLIETRNHPDFGRLINAGTSRHGEAGDYALRGTYLNHPLDKNNRLATPAVSANRLLWQGEIDLANEVLPPTLEMVDLPGLAAGKYHDTCVTMDVLRNTGGDGLDGALVFLNSGQLDNSSVDTLVMELQQNWRAKGRDRVWLILTCYDVLTDAHLGATGNWMDSVPGKLQSLEISPNCMFIVSNKVIETHNKNPGKSSPEEREDLSGGTLGRPWDDEHLQAHLNRHPAFGQLVREVYLNGGMQNLRQALVTRLANDISNEVAAEVRQLLASASGNLDNIRRQFEFRKKQKPDDRRKILQCAARVDGIIHECKKGLEEFRKATTDLAATLRSTMQTQSGVANIKQINPALIPTTFPLLADALEQALSSQVMKSCEELYNRVKGELEKSNLPAIPLKNAESVTAAWEKSRAAVVEEVLDASKPRFAIPVVTDDLPRLRLAASQFNNIFEEKIRSVTIETMHEIKTRLIADLTGIHRDLQMLSRT